MEGLDIVNTLKRRIKSSNSPQVQGFINMLRELQRASFPVIPGLHSAAYNYHNLSTSLLADVKRSVYYTPLFRSQLKGTGKGLRISGIGMPMIIGSVEITMGDKCRVHAAMTIAGRTASLKKPELIIGNNVGFGWQTSISVGTRIILEDNVRVSSRVLMSGYPGHPLNAADRRVHLPDTDDQCGDIILRRDVWLGTGVIVGPRVEIGEGTVVAAGSVVTHDLPPNVLAAGAPAKVKRDIPNK